MSFSLSKTRRKRAVPEDWASSELIGSYKVKQTSEPLYAGSKAIALDATGDLALVGGQDGVAGIYSVSQNKLVQALKGAAGAITDALWWNNHAVIAAESGAVKIFKGAAEIANFTSHAGSCTALAMHPSGELLASVGVDKSYVFYDLAGLKAVTQVYSDSGMSWPCCQCEPSADFRTGLTSAGFHPDGHLFAAGSEGGQIKVFDVTSGANAANFDCSSAVKALAFSENGTWLAAVSKGESNVGIWDLRKAAQIKSLDMGSQVDGVRWDYTGQFLAAAGPSGIAIQSYSKATKQWAESLRTAVPAVAVQWGPQAQRIVSVSGEGVISVVGAS